MSQVCWCPPKEGERTMLTITDLHKTFSGGVQALRGIAQALIGQPQLIIVDEPTAGLDPEERNRFHNLLAEMASENAIVILSTHIVADVSSVCSHLSVIRRGEILSFITPRQAIRELA